jgi:hypothetical protein
MTTRFALLSLLGASVAVAIAACGPESATQPDNALTEIQPDCLECMRTLAECTSTAQNEEQFVGCRDVFQACEEKMSLGPDECGRPSNEQACDLCRERADKCPEANEGCDVQFSVCKTFLMTRDQDGCTAQPAEVLGDCQSCIETLAACAFGGDDAAICEAGFNSCRNANKITPASCPGPSVGDTCEACLKQHQTCQASTDADCDAGWKSCVDQLATENACGSGPSMGGGEGGGGSTGPLCPHDACEAGEKMDATCDACIAGVCELDSFCCESEYDAFCVEEAATVAACGCAPTAMDTCVHDVCTAGDMLETGCNDCATTVCDSDGFCCNSEWDSLCVQHAVELCAATCG